MPTYDYACGACGGFDALRPMAERNEPCACPTCGKPSPRVLTGAPSLPILAHATRLAHATNEKSAHLPQARHGAGCSCCGVSGAGGKSPAGAKSFPGRRPWMISH